MSESRHSPSGASRRSRRGADRRLGVAREGLPIIIVIAGAGAVVGVVAVWAFAGPGWIAAAAGLAVTAWAVWFFRDPERAAPDRPGTAVSAADGRVVSVGPASPPAELGLDEDQARGMIRIAVFMNVFNVHVNRAPVAGVVRRIRHHPGRFFNASLDKASEHNERCSMLIEMPDGGLVACVQIAGLVARRIVCRVGEGDRLAIGERFGIIRFGSRVDHYLPAGFRPDVAPGDRVTAGRTVIATATGPAAALDRESATLQEQAAGAHA